MGLRKRNIVIAAAFPPPLHGLSKISDSITSDLAKLADVHRFDLSSRSLARSPVYHLRVSVAGRRATHIFLCQLMERRFRDNYSGQWRGLISSNVVHIPAIPELASRVTDRITVGLLSNLTQEKGLHLFLELVRACISRGLPVMCRLAGPKENAADAAVVEAARSEIGEHLDYLGPLYGAEKDRFLSELDIFAFPTMYRNEAQPNAVFEAMSAGAAVVVFARGCLGEDVSCDCGLLIEPSADFVSAACEQLARWNEDRAVLTEAKAAARQRFAERKAAAVEGYQQLLRAIADRELPARL